MGEFPSRAHQFGPGNNANPGGRPRGKTLSRLMREALDMTEVFGKPVPDGLTLAQALVVTAAQQAIKGKYVFLREFLNRTEGKVKTHVDLSVKELPPVDLGSLTLDDLKSLGRIAAELDARRSGGGEAGG